MTRVEGTGVHSGLRSSVRLHRSDGPVRFLRSGRELRPGVEEVVSTRGCTVLGGDGVRVATVEHLLAALYVRSVFEGLVIEVDGDEIPILDGSAAPWDQALAALAPFPSPPAPLVGEAAVRSGASEATLVSGATRLTVRIDFPHPAILRQSWTGTPADFPDLLPARTFGFAREARALRDAGLARGASDRNAIVFGDDGPSTPLRSPDEPARHKALDALGDLYLAGRPVAGHLTVDRGGHELHLRLVSALTGRDRQEPHRGEVA